MDGTGPGFFTPSDHPANATYTYEIFPPVRACDAATLRRVSRCFYASDLTDELRRRKAQAVPEPVSRTPAERSDGKYSPATYSVRRSASVDAMP